MQRVWRMARLLLWTVVVLWPATLLAQGLGGSAFTFQGQLSNVGGPVNATCDLRASLYDVAAGGSALAGPLERNNVVVSDGLFVVPLDFGAAVFAGGPRWLEIAVRCPAGSGSFNTLSPRQALTPAPYALTAGRVDWAGVADVPANLVGLAALVCNASEGPRWNGSAWECALPTGPQGPPGEKGDPGSPGAPGVGFRTDCANGELARWNGADWACATESDPLAWRLTGNPATNPNTHFLGTTDVPTMTLRVSNTVGLRLLLGTDSNDAGTDVTASLIGGDASNTIPLTVEGSAIGGGAENRASASYATVSGGYSNTITSSYATVGGGRTNRATGNSATVAGGRSNSTAADWAFVGGGDGNQATGIGAMVGGGSSNVASGDSSAVAGGSGNLADGAYAAVGGGADNTTSNDYTFIGGGQSNQVTGYQAAVLGGEGNAASGELAAVVGGDDNRAEGTASFVGGGADNTAGGEQSVVGGGALNSAQGETSTVAGGMSNIASAVMSVVGGGNLNEAGGDYAVVAGGNENQANGPLTTVGGGQANQATSELATISGGSSNLASAFNATVGGGTGNQAIAIYATVAGGAANLATGQFSTVVGGSQARATLYGQVAQASGGFAAIGDAQRSESVMRASVNTGSTVELGLDGTTTHRLTLADHRAMTASVLLVARTQNGGVYSGQWHCYLVNEGGTTIGDCSDVVTPSGLGALASNFTVTIGFNNVHDALVISVNNTSGVTARVVATVTAVEVAFP